MKKIQKIKLSELSVAASLAAMEEPEGNIVFARPKGRGWKVFSIPPNEVGLAQVQGALEGALEVVFD